MSELLNSCGMCHWQLTPGDCDIFEEREIHSLTLRMHSSRNRVVDQSPQRLTFCTCAFLWSHELTVLGNSFQLWLTHDIPPPHSFFNYKQLWSINYVRTAQGCLLQPVRLFNYFIMYRVLWIALLVFLVLEIISQGPRAVTGCRN